MGAPHCRSCNSWHYEYPVNPCPAKVNGFVRPDRPVNPYKGTVLEKWYPEIKRTPERDREWARVLGKDYVAESVMPKRNGVTPETVTQAPTVTHDRNDETVTLSNAERQKRYRDRQKEKKDDE
jgi:hypothetical protein